MLALLLTIGGLRSVALTEGQVVINEIHYHPAETLDDHEFIELHNPTNQAIDLSGWELEGAVRYRFDDGAQIPRGGFLVVAGNPAALTDAFGVTVLGAFDGRLSNDGEVLRLEDANGELVDEVAYQGGFPWPTAAAGGGASMELVHPMADNSQGGAWRSSGYADVRPLELRLAQLQVDRPEWGQPSPGLPNRNSQSESPPLVVRVEHLPVQPTSADALTIEVRVRDLASVAGVTLQVQEVAPGAFQPAYLPLAIPVLRAEPDRVPALNPAFTDPNSWNTHRMTDLGEAGDRVAGDGVFSVRLPSFENRTLVRYRIEVERTDPLLVPVIVPYGDDPSLNFACFVYDGVPAYPTTMRSILEEGVGAVHSADAMRSLPVYHFLTRENDWMVCHGYDPFDRIQLDLKDARRVFNWEGAFVYEGVVYDHVGYRLRQNNDRYNHRQGGKRALRFRFNRAQHLQTRNAAGEFYTVPWRSLNLSKMIDGKQNQTFGLPEAMNSWLWNLVGVPAPQTHYVQLRVVDGADENPAGEEGQFHGDFWGLFLALEDYDAGFVRRHGLPDGNLYKLKSFIFDGNELKRHQGRGATGGDEDYQNIRHHLRPERDADWLRNHVDFSRWYRYHTVNEAVRHFDYLPNDRFQKNRAWFFEPTPQTELGRLWVLPWDSDTSWGPNWGTGLDYPKQAIFGFGGKPVFKTEYRNFIRTFRDLIWTRENIEARLDALTDRIRLLSRADRDRWIDAPFGPPIPYGSLADKVADMKAFAFEGWIPWDERDPPVPAGGRARHLEELAQAEGEGDLLPPRPVIRYAGPEGFPLGGEFFQIETPGPVGTAGGNWLFRWRLADRDTAAMRADGRRPQLPEWPGLWVSDLAAVSSGEWRLPLGMTEPGVRYRVRVQLLDRELREGRWSEPFDWVAGSVGETGVESAALRVVEIFYNPGDAENLEFIELMNVGERSIWLGGLELRGGVEFILASQDERAIGPGERVVVVRDREAFLQTYPGTREHVVGAFAGKLSNGSDDFSLWWGGERLQDVAYDDDWYPETDGLGASLVGAGGDGTPNATSRSAWLPGSVLGGTPAGISQLGDRDADGIRDAWELAQGLDPFDARDAGRVATDLGENWFQRWESSQCERFRRERFEIGVGRDGDQIELQVCPQGDPELDDLAFVREVRFEKRSTLNAEWEACSPWVAEDGSGVRLRIPVAGSSEQTFFRAVMRLRDR